MDNPNRNAKIRTGNQKVTAPVAEMSKSSSEPLPCCQNRTTKPKVAATDTMLSSTALRGSSSERKARTRSR